MKRRPSEALIIKVDLMVFSPIMRGRERPKRTLREVIKMNIWLNRIFESLIWDRK